MSEPVQRRSLLKLAASTAATGWLWQTGVAQAAETEAAPTEAAEACQARWTPSSSATRPRRRHTR
ncbi:hypothetical protein O1M54_06255 [Streptomyces diastatochromogenes]|nr:hypothetical protein [Streptomyces diastatochromogenes]